MATRIRGRQRVMQVCQTESIDGLGDHETFDAAVIGAGPAGSVAAVQLARLGYKTILIDKQTFPRDKVCGSCLSGKAVASIQKMGLDDSLDGSIPLTEFVLATSKRQVNLHCEGGRAISRRRFDVKLIDHAIKSGARFFPGTKVTAGKVHDDHREIRLTSSGTDRLINSRLTLLCTGLGKGNISEWGLSDRIFRKSRIGITTYAQRHEGYLPGVIYMCVHRDGYLGITTLEDGRLNLSACVDRDALRTTSPLQLTSELLKYTRIKPPAFDDKQRWMGTPELSRRLLCPASHRLLALGDAAGYAEPFTGQGISWAMEASQDIPLIAERAIHRWDPSLIRQWRTLTLRRQRSQQRVCNLTKWLARSPFAMETLVRLLRGFPALASPFINAIHRA